MHKNEAEETYQMQPPSNSVLLNEFTFYKLHYNNSCESK